VQKIKQIKEREKKVGEVENLKNK